MQMKVSTLKAKSALFDVNKIKGSENKILTATKDIRKDYDSSRGFGLATLTAITTYKDPKQGFKSRDEFESLLYEALAHGASDIFISPDRPITMMKDLLGEMANTISGNARTEFGSEFIISPPQIVESAPSVSYLPRDRQSYITPFTWRGYKAVIGICIA